MPTKKLIYLIASVILWSLLGFIAGIILEKIYINALLAQGKYAPFFPFGGINFYLNPVWQFILIIAGAIGGYFIGQVWWRIVYIEKRHWRMKKDKTV
jgi:hypothetical protein